MDLGILFGSKKIEKKISNIHKTLETSFGNVKSDMVKIYDWLNHFYQKSMQQDEQINKLYHEILKLSKQKNHKNSEKITLQLNHLKDQLSHLKTTQVSNNELITTKFSELDLSINEVNSRLYRVDQNEENISEIQRKLDRIHAEILRENEPLRSKMRELESHLEELKYSEKLGSLPVTELKEIHYRLEKLEKKKSTIKEKIIKKITRNSKEYIKTIIVSYIKKYGTISAMQLKEMLVEEQGICSKSSFYRFLEEIEELDEIGTIKKGKEKHYIAKNIKIQ